MRNRILIMLALATAALASSAHAEWQWEHPGAAPFAKTRAEAMQNREEAIRKLGFPEKCVAPLAEAMDKPGEEVTMKMGDRFAAQISKGGVVHGLGEGGGVVAFKTPMLPGMQLVAQAEKWSVACEGQTQTVFMPAVCFNLTAGIPVPASSVAAPAKPSELKPIAGSCPNRYHLKVYVYPWKAMSFPGVAQTAAKEELEENFVHGVSDPQHVSRTHYTQLQRALASGDLQYSPTPHVFRVSLIMTPESAGEQPAITKEEVLGDITVKDYYYEVPLTLAQIKEWDAIRLVPVGDDDFASPPRYHKVGFHEIRFFNRLPGTKLGEWDSNPDPDCTMGVLFIERETMKK